MRYVLVSITARPPRIQCLLLLRIVAAEENNCLQKFTRQACNLTVNRFDRASTKRTSASSRKESNSP